MLESRIVKSRGKLLFLFSTMAASAWLAIASTALAAPGDITTVAGTGTEGSAGDGGAATSAQLAFPWGVGFDTSGRLYIADSGNQKTRRIATSGTISTFAGNGVAGFSGDGGPATAAQLSSTGAVASSGNSVYISDFGNNRIRRVDASGTITTFAGNGTAGFGGDGGPATSASLNQPRSIVVDGAGNLYIADSGNSRVRRVTPSGTITTYAGNGTAGAAGDGGPATDAELDYPVGLALDDSGNLYIADAGSHRVRRVNSAGTITRVAGTGTAGSAGDGGPATSAQLNGPYGLAVDSAGSLYIADFDANRVRRVSSSGTISTFAGTGTAGSAGDNGPATAAQLNYPHGLTLDTSGNLYIADSGNQRVRKVAESFPPNTTIDSGPTGTINDSTPTFAFSSSEAGSSFECRVDAAAFATCTSPHTTAVLADGAHTLEVRAVDAAGNVDPTPAQRSFTVDATPPNTTINSGPSGATSDTTPTFAFSSSKAGSSFECRVDSGAYAPCTSPQTTAQLADGPHTFSVRATDSVGNVDPTPAQRSFTVDTSNPQTSISSGPSGATNDPTPTFAFSSSEAGSSFECRVDSGAYSGCNSPTTTAQLADGSHTFSVRATDSVGNVDPTPAQRSFTVDTASVSVSGSTLRVIAAGDATDLLEITRHSDGTLLVTDLAAGAYSGSGVHAGAGCTQNGDDAARCDAAGVKLVEVKAGDGADMVTNSTPLKSDLSGGSNDDKLIGGSDQDTLTGGTGVDELKGVDGNDLLKARDNDDDEKIACGDGGRDEARLDDLPNDRGSVVTGCESKVRR